LLGNSIIWLFIGGDMLVFNILIVEDRQGPSLFIDDVRSLDSEHLPPS
jgi:hypothetical protein